MAQADVHPNHPRSPARAAFEALIGHRTATCPECRRAPTLEGCTKKIALRDAYLQARGGTAGATAIDDVDAGVGVEAGGTDCQGPDATLPGGWA